MSKWIIVMEKYETMGCCQLRSFKLFATVQNYVSLY